jgi:hypothetical protein
MTMNIENYRTWAWASLIVGLLIVVFTFRLSNEEAKPVAKKSAINYWFWGEILIAVLLVAAGGWALTRPRAPESITPGSF